MSVYIVSHTHWKVQYTSEHPLEHLSNGEVDVRLGVNLVPVVGLASAVRVDESEVVVALGTVVLVPLVAALPVLLSLDLQMGDQYNVSLPLFRRKGAYRATHIVTPGSREEANIISSVVLQTLKRVAVIGCRVVGSGDRVPAKRTSSLVVGVLDKVPLALLRVVDAPAPNLVHRVASGILGDRSESIGRVAGPAVLAGAVLLLAVRCVVGDPVDDVHDARRETGIDVRLVPVVLHLDDELPHEGEDGGLVLGAAAVVRALLGLGLARSLDVGEGGLDGGNGRGDALQRDFGRAVAVEVVREGGGDLLAELGDVLHDLGRFVLIGVHGEDEEESGVDGFGDGAEFAEVLAVVEVELSVEEVRVATDHVVETTEALGVGTLEPSRPRPVGNVEDSFVDLDFLRGLGFRLAEGNLAFRIVLNFLVVPEELLPLPGKGRSFTLELSRELGILCVPGLSTGASELPAVVGEVVDAALLVTS